MEGVPKSGGLTLDLASQPVSPVAGGTWTRPLDLVDFQLR